jgi:hypothetical protein
MTALGSERDPPARARRPCLVLAAGAMLVVAGGALIGRLG